MHSRLTFRLLNALWRRRRLLPLLLHTLLKSRLRRPLLLLPGLLLLHLGPPLLRLLLGPVHPLLILHWRTALLLELLSLARTRL